MSGTVSMASTSAPASARISSRGRCHSSIEQPSARIDRRTPRHWPAPRRTARRRGHPAAVAPTSSRAVAASSTLRRISRSASSRRDSARRETVEGRLVARRRRDRRARPIRTPVSCDDLVGRVEQQPRRPQVVGQVVAAGLEFSRQATIADQHGIVGGCERHFATLRSARGQPLGPVTAATRQGHSGAFMGVVGRVRRYVLQTQLNTTDAIRLYRSHRAGMSG